MLEYEFNILYLYKFIFVAGLLVVSDIEPKWPSKEKEKHKA